MASELDDVLDAVAAILERDGLAGLTLTAIAEEAGISRVTLHRRGASVEGCVVAVLRRASDDLRASLWPALTGTDDAESRLAQALRVLCDVFDRHGGILAAVYAHPAWPLPDQPDRTTSFEFIEPFQRIIADGNLDGSLHSEDPRRDATLVANTVAWVYLHMRRAHRWEPEEAATRVVDMAMSCLAPEPA